MYFTLEKLKANIPAILAAAQRADALIPDVFIAPDLGDPHRTVMAPPPAPGDPGWAALRPYEKMGVMPGVDPGQPPAKLGWGFPVDGGHMFWMRARFTVPASWRGAEGKSVLFTFDWQDQGNGDHAIEAVVYLDGVALAGFDEFHRSAVLPPSALDGEHEIGVRLYAPYPKVFAGFRLIRRDEAIFRLGHTLRAAVEAVQTLRDSDLARTKMLDALNAAYNHLDLRDGFQSERFARSACEALSLLDRDLPARASAGPRPRVMATGHSHLDIGWLWPVWRSRHKVAHTVATALHLMERYPDYHFSISQPQVLAFLKEDDPALFARAKAMAAEGRFEPVGTMWVEADCNVTSGESLVRQFVHGARFWREAFGMEPRLVWLPDVFGYTAAMPQIMRLCGIDCFMTTKISWNQFNRTPNDTFRWRGIDGTEVLAHFITASADPVKHPSEAQFFTYNGDMSGGQVFGLWNHYRQKAINADVLYSFGWGDGGGGPTETMLEAARVFSDLPSFPQVMPGRVADYFEALKQRVWDNPELPVWSGELYLEFHRGTYTSQAKVKQGNRRAELALREAEWLDALAALLTGAESHAAELDGLWKTVLLNQFHDILPGSSVPLVYADTHAEHAHALREAGEIRDASMARLFDQVALDGPSVIVLNTLPFPREEVIAVPLAEGESDLRLERSDGELLPTQIVDDPDGGKAALVMVNVLGYGYTVLRQCEGSADEPPMPVSVTGRTLTNGFLRLELDQNGEIVSLVDLQTNREIAAPGKTLNQLVAYEDRPLTWDAWDIEAYYEEKPYPVQDVESWRVVESGPLRGAIETVRRYGESRIAQRITMHAGSRRVDVVTDVDWQARQTLLRALFPLDINANRATCEIQFGAVERPTHRNTSWDVARFEVCAHRWVDLSEGDYGVALLNDGKYGHSLHDSTLGLSLLRSPIHPDPDADRGQHHFTYSLYPHEGDWRRAGVVREAYALNAPLHVARRNGPQPGTLPARWSFIGALSDHIVVETIKAADDGDGLIVRLYEAHNQRGWTKLRFSLPVKSAVLADLFEQEIGAVDVTGNEVMFPIRPFEIKTLRVKF